MVVVAMPRLPFRRIHINITPDQYEYLARRAFVEMTSMTNVARNILEAARLKDERAAQRRAERGE